MAIVSKTTEPTEQEIIKSLNESLPMLLDYVVALGVSETPTSEMLAITDKFMPTSARANLRARPGTAKSKSVAKVVENEVIDTLSGNEFYERPNGNKYYSRLWGKHTDIEVLRKARENKQYVLLYGAPGCGKTALAEATFGDDLLTILGTGDTEVSDFVGNYVQTPSGSFEWIDGVLTQAVEQGKVLLIDEVGLIDPKVMAIVYGLMDGRDELTITANAERGTIKAKDGFYVICATNPNAPGVRLSEALLSRCVIQAEMTTDYSLAKKLGVPAHAVSVAQNLNKKQISGEVSWSPQMRELLAFRDVSKIYGTEWAVSNLLASAPEMDRPVVVDVFTRVFGVECKPAKI